MTAETTCERCGVESECAAIIVTLASGLSWESPHCERCYDTVEGMRSHAEKRAVREWPGKKDTV
jgi:hypothetical protein